MKYLIKNDDKDGHTTALHFFRPQNGGEKCSGAMKGKWKICKSEVSILPTLNYISLRSAAAEAFAFDM